MQQLKNFPRWLKPLQQKLQPLAKRWAKLKKFIEKLPQAQRDRLLTLFLVLVLGFAGWYQYNEDADNFAPISFPLITPRTAQDIDVGFDFIVAGHQGVSSVAIDDGGTTIASSYEDGSFSLWKWIRERQTYKFIQNVEEQKVQSIALSPDGTILASGKWDGTIQLWNLDSDNNTLTQMGQPLNAGKKRVLSVAFNLDGTILASGNADGTIQLWNWDAQKDTFNPASQPLQKGKAGVDSVAFTPDSKILASGDDEGILKLWNVETRKKTDEIEAHLEPIYSLACSSFPSRFFLSLEKHQLVSASYSGTIKLWTINNFGKLHQESKTLVAHKGHLSVALSNDGKILASGSEDGVIEIWNTLSGKLLRKLMSHPYGVSSLAFDDFSETLISGSLDETVKVWRVKAKTKMGWKFPQTLKLYPN